MPMTYLHALALSLALAFSYALTSAVAPTMTSAQGHSGHASPYAGFETRAIKSLSPNDMEELRRGGGWGLALAAELNGVPGPAHLLELRDEIALSVDQVAAIQAIFDEMQSEAVAAGARLIKAEETIEAAFRAGNLDDERLRALIAEAEAARAELRFIHLSRHLSTPPLLSADQVARYTMLRGYGSDPCANVPNGHNAEMWRRHNNCN
ncbi:MAG: hypothetical protein ACFCUN_04985 [Hyphomicrobiaceae bacterium]